MSLFPSIGVPTPVAPLEALSRDLFDLDFASVEWSPDSGGFVSASGQVGTFARGATLGSVIDVNGTPYHEVHAQPAWEQRDWDADAVREAFGLRMGSADTLAFPVTFLWPAGGMSGMLEFIETGAVTNTGSTVLALTRDDGTGNGFYLAAHSSGRYEARYTRTSAPITGTLAAVLSSAPTVDDRVRLTWEITAAGVLSLHQALNGEARTSVTAAGTLAPPAALEPTTSIHLGGRGPTANLPAQAWYRRVRLVAGSLNHDVIAERR